MKYTENEKIARKVVTLLVRENMWQDVRIYFDGKFFDSNKPIPGRANPNKFFEGNREYICMSFEGPLYHSMHGYGKRKSIRGKLSSIFKKHGLYYEYGDAWNLSLYRIK